MNRIILHCGNGRGKSSSAFGVVTRALAHGKKVLAVQFFKPSKDAALAFLEKNAPEQLTVKNYGEWYFADRADAKAPELYHAALQEVVKLIEQDDHDVILLDEIFYTVQFGLIDEDEICSILNLLDNKCFILTGRNAPAKLQEMADTVSSIECIKHAFDSGVKAQCGIEF